jgi:hypothetical protein
LPRGRHGIQKAPTTTQKSGERSPRRKDEVDPLRIGHRQPHEPKVSGVIQKINYYLRTCQALVLDILAVQRGKRYGGKGLTARAGGPARPHLCEMRDNLLRSYVFRYPGASERCSLQVVAAIDLYAIIRVRFGGGSDAPMERRNTAALRSVKRRSVHLGRPAPRR